MPRLFAPSLVLLSTALLLPLVTNVVAPSPKSVDANERVALSVASNDSLGAMRAGDARGTAGVTGDERGELSKAQSASHDLGAMRGGDVHLSDHDLTIIGVVLLAVLVILIIA